ncbi:uncharacterized protein [Amphiura filiformis]|uniref:uncharacterized protein n=1 Tax=Amphiura filiformis TaxID=82378 RepID=UPI003B20FBEC
MGASVKPTFIWQRVLTNDATTLVPPIQGLSLQHTVYLVSDDIGATFTCVMNHPLLETPRTCSLIPLPQPSPPEASPTFTLNPTNEHLTLSRGKAATITYATTKQLLTTPMENAQPTKPYSRKNQSHTLPVVLAVIFILIASVVGIILVLVWRKRNRKIPIPSRPDYVLTIEKDCSITPDYSVVNAPDSIDKARKLSPKTTTQKQSSTDQNFNNGNPEDTRNCNGCIQDGDEYENINQRNSSQGPLHGTSQNDELTYADLELPEISQSNTLARIAQSQQDATVYADIQGTL